MHQKKKKTENILFFNSFFYQKEEGSKSTSIDRQKELNWIECEDTTLNWDEDKNTN